MYEERIDLLRRASLNLEDNSTRPEIDIQEISDTLKNLRVIAGSFGEPRLMSSNDESLESLGEVTFATGRIIESLMEMKRKVPQPASHEDESTFSLLNNIDYLVDDFNGVMNFLGRKQQTLRNYLG